MELKIENIKTKLLKELAEFVQASDKQNFKHKTTLLNTESSLNQNY